MYVDWVPPHLGLVVCYISHLLIHLPCKTWRYKDYNKNSINLVLNVLRTLGTSNQTIFYNLCVTIDHHGPSIHSGYYTASINCCKKHILLQRQQNYGVWNYWKQKLLDYICYTLWIDWLMSFGLDQEGGRLITPMALAHPFHSINTRSRNKRRKLWVGWCVSSRWPLFRTVLGECAVPVLNATCCFLWFHQLCLALW